MGRPAWRWSLRSRRVRPGEGRGFRSSRHRPLAAKRLGMVTPDLDDLDDQRPGVRVERRLQGGRVAGDFVFLAGASDRLPAIESDGRRNDTIQIERLLA